MTQQNPITDEQLNEIAARAAGLYEYATGLDTAWQDEADQLAGTDVPALLAAVRRLRDALTAIRHLHKDSPMGPCPVCIDADAVAAGGDGLMPYPCPTGRLAGAEDCEPPHVRAAIETGMGPCDCGVVPFVHYEHSGRLLPRLLLPCLGASSERHDQAADFLT